MPNPTRIKAQTAGTGAVVRVLMSHEMETGRRLDAAGRTVPAWFIQQVKALHNGRVVMSAYWGTSVSKNPSLQFSVEGAKAGDSITIEWVDNRGERRSDEVRVLPGT
jgi:sulfur-oxidizing protein SoxZ